jgi:hypothetical protein
MPWFPLVPIVGLVSLGFVLVANWGDPDVGRPSLIYNAILIIIAMAYYFLVLRRRGDWVLRGPEDHHVQTSDEAADN